MPIKIKRKPNTRLTWEANALFRESFPAKDDTFIIPNINWMVYLHKSFDLIEATDENGSAIDLRSVMSCCKGSIKLEIAKKSSSADNVVKLNTAIDEILEEDDKDTTLFTE